MSDSTPGWQPDPSGKHDHRYWDGSQWTDDVADAGVASTDPYETAAPEPPSAEEPVTDETPWAEAPADETPAADEPLGEEPVAEDPIGHDPVAPVAPIESGESGEEPAFADDTVVDQEVPSAEATASYGAVTDEPAAWSDAPAPPPPYVPTDVPAEGSGAKKGLLIGGGILAAVVLAALAFTAFGGDDDESSVRAELASKIEEEADGDLSSSQAECMADLIVDEAGEDAFSDTNFDAEEAPAEVAAAVLDVGIDTMVEECDIDASALGNDPGSTDDGTDSTDTTEGGGAGSYGSDPELDELYDGCEDGDFAACDQLYLDSPTGSEYETFGDTCGGRNEPSGYCETLYADDGGGDGGTTEGAADLPDDYREQLAGIYESTLGLSSEQAECLAGKLADAIEDGTITEEQATSEFLDYLSDCDISLEEIGGN